jgi:Ca2+-binding RTX toxin-like protein
MAAIADFGGSVSAEAGQYVLLDMNAAITGADALLSIRVSLAGFDGMAIDDYLAVTSGGRIRVDVSSDQPQIFYDEQLIGHIGSDGAGGNELSLHFDGYGPAVTNESVTAVLRAIAYRNNSSAIPTAEKRTIKVELEYGSSNDPIVVAATKNVLVRPDSAIVLTSGSDTIAGTAGDDVFVIDSSTVLAGLDLTGGPGDDALHVVGGSLFQLLSSNVSRFWGIESLHGSADEDEFEIGSEHFLALSEIDGGGEEQDDTLYLSGNYFDFRNKTITGFEEIIFASGNARIVVNDKAVTQFFAAMEPVTLHLIGGTFTDAERAALLTRNITALDDEDNLINDPLEVVGLDGERVGVTAGATVLLDQDQNFEMVDDGLIHKLRVGMAQASSDDLLGIRANNGISLSHGVQQGSRVTVGDSEIGTINIATSGLIEILFNGNATAVQVQKLIRALTYTRTGPANAPFTERDILVSITDDGNHTELSTVTIFGTASGNRAPTDVKFNGHTTVSVPENTAFAAALSATDPDGDPVSFAFDASAAGGGNAGGMFVIDDATKQLKLAPGKILDFETARSHTVYIKASDGNTFSASQALTINITDMDETPPNLVLVGTSRADRLMGGDGNDRLSGGLGKDVLTGGQGKDIFVFDTKPNTKTNLDTVTDFSVADDTIWLDNKYLKKLGKGSAAKPGKLNKKVFKVADKAKDGNDYLVYNKKTGVLSYDEDGSGAKAAVQIAKLSKGLKLTADDFFVI